MNPGSDPVKCRLVPCPACGTRPTELVPSCGIHERRPALACGACGCSTCVSRNLLGRDGMVADPVLAWNRAHQYRFWTRPAWYRFNDVSGPSYRKPPAPENTQGGPTR